MCLWGKSRSVEFGLGVGGLGRLGLGNFGFWGPCY